MKTKIQSLLIMLALLASLRQTIAQGTTFTYQGQLQNNGNPADNSYDLTFALFNSSSGAGQVGSTITYTGIGVSNGLFTVVLDFGANFPGADRWLEIGVRTNGGSGFTTLTPRQKLTPTPYAITAGNLNGVLPVAQLPGTVLTNHESGVTLTNLMLTGALNLPNTATGPDIIYSGSALLLEADNNGNFFSGLGAGNLTMSGTNNTGIGDSALQNNLSGFDNTAVGYQALYQSTNGYYNTAIGYETLFNNSSLGNTAVGFWALYFNTFGSANTAIGSDALIHNSIGYGNTAVGEEALYYNTNGYNNTASGGEALFSTTSGNYNAANGYKALYNNVTGDYNTANGALALFYNTTGSFNTADGLGTLYSNTTGSFNTADGNYALYNSTGSGNIALGYYAGSGFTTGDDNIDIGNTGDANDTGVIRIGDPEEQTTTYIAGNVGLGGASPQQTLSLNGGMNIDQSGQNAGLFNNSAGSGYGLSFGSGSGEGIASQRTGSGGALNGLSFYTSFGNRMTIMNNGLVGINTTNPSEQLSVNGGANKPGGGSWDTFSDGRLKDIGTKFTHGLEAMAGIQPIHYHYKSDNSLQLPSQPEYVGVVAQQVQSAVPEAVHQDPGGYLVVNNDPIIWTMFNAIKELNQKRESEAKEKDAEIQTLKQQNDLLAERLNGLEAKVEQLAAQK